MRVGRVMAANNSTPLVVRASLPRTFWSLGLFAEASLMFAGIYMLTEELKRPLEANQTALICAGVLLSLATILLFYLIGPKRFHSLAKEEEPLSESRILESPLTAYGEQIKARQRAEQEMEKDLLPGPM